MSLSATHPTQFLSYLQSCARSRITSTLAAGMVVGQLTIHDSAGTHVFGREEAPPLVATISVSDDIFWLRLFLTYDVGFAESFLLGEIEIDDIGAVHKLWLANSAKLEGLSTSIHMLYSMIGKLANYFLGQSLTRSKLNAVAGYDESNSLFKAFLSEEMMYSCALWADAEGVTSADLVDPVNPSETDLEAAQGIKIRHVLRKARIRKGDHILEIGSGWCGLAIEAARMYDCTVDTVTLSAAQKALGEQRIRAAGLQSLINVHLVDYRKLPQSFEGAFDSVISIEMIEHVGPRHYKQFFQIINWALKKEGGTVVVSSSTMPEARYQEYQPPDFCRLYIWPNGTLPSATAIITAAQTGSAGQLCLDSVENHGRHYARTLRCWKQRFEANVQEGLIDDILCERPDLAEGGKLEPFLRKWLYLFSYAEAGFSQGYVTCHMVVFAKGHQLGSVTLATM